MNRRNKKITKNIKDYIVPIVWWAIIFILIVNFIFWDKSENPNNTLVNNIPLELSLDDPNSKAYIVYSSWDKKDVSEVKKLYKWEKLEIWTTWEVEITNSWWTYVLNRLWELKYNEDGTFTLISSDLWVNNSSPITIETKYAVLTAPENSVFNVSQNEVASTIYNVWNNIEVKNLVWSKTTLQKWQKITIMRPDANEEWIDLSLKKAEIDDYTKNDDWFISNNWNYYLNQNSDSNTNSGSTNTWSSYTWGTSFSYISFNIEDESDVNTDNINISWNILDDIVSKIEIDWKTADVNKENNTFSLENLELDSRVNNLVYRVYDESNSLLNKWVITLYYAQWTSNNNNNDSFADVENYEITHSPSYPIISPNKNPYTTTEDLVMIEWNVPARTVSKIVINGFELQQFPANWTYWKYFANKEFWNLKEWLNIYHIKYYWSDDKIIFENNFLIIKLPEWENTSTTQTWSNN